MRQAVAVRFTPARKPGCLNFSGSVCTTKAEPACLELIFHILVSRVGIYVVIKKNPSISLIWWVHQRLIWFGELFSKVSYNGVYCRLTCITHASWATAWRAALPVPMHDCAVVVFVSRIPSGLEGLDQTVLYYISLIFAPHFPPRWGLRAAC